MTQQLNLNSAPKILFLFGLSGSGKSYIGDLIGQKTDRYVYHADEDITEEMILALKEQRPFTESMRDQYFPIIAEKIVSLCQEHNAIVVTQGVYKQRHREYLEAQLSDLEMIFVDAGDAHISERLSTRGDGITDESAAALRKDFELPPERIKVIVNEGGEEVIVAQLNDHFSFKSE